jgi:hypothetical protein
MDKKPLLGGITLLLVAILLTVWLYFTAPYLLAQYFWLIAFVGGVGLILVVAYLWAQTRQENG